MSKFDQIINFAKDNPKLVQAGFDTAFSLIKAGTDLVELLGNGSLTEEELKVLVDKYSAEKDEAVQEMIASIQARRDEESN